MADDMGLGKTIQVAVYLECLMQSRQIGSCLLIVPASVLTVWEDALKSWTRSTMLGALRVDVPVLLFHGVKEGRKREIRILLHRSFHVLLTTYGMTRRHIQFLCSMWNADIFEYRLWDYVILDEGHKVRSMVAIHCRSATAIPKCRSA